ncbi:hypothetical protein DFJ43DRAFT_1040990 [Lentinula guzmanii]|uniref:Uncharacterized protein n=1 Tax=Lentinula guzmanii TaxID=2804957 RepID=A0AA38JJU8_9AGAR|nr:hypothetical protein DFJ43DRAFT_1040990 [Lentinula guzmanii]
MPNTRAQTKCQTRSNGLTDAVTLSTMNMPGKRTRKKQTTVAGPSETHTRPPRRTKKPVTKKVNATPAPESSASRAAQQHSPAPMEHSPSTIPSPAHPSASSPTQPRSSPPIQHPPTTRSLSPACPLVASPPPPNSPAPSLPPPSSNPPVSTPGDWEEEDDGLTAAILSNDIQSVQAFVKSHTKSIPANKRIILRSIRQRFIGELQTLALIPEHGDHWPGPDNIPTVLPPLQTYLHGVDEEGYYGIVTPFKPLSMQGVKPSCILRKIMTPPGEMHYAWDTIIGFTVCVIVVQPKRMSAKLRGSVGGSEAWELWLAARSFGSVMGLQRSY